MESSPRFAFVCATLACGLFLFVIALRYRGGGNPWKPLSGARGWPKCATNSPARVFLLEGTMAAKCRIAVLLPSGLFLKPCSTCVRN